MALCTSAIGRERSLKSTASAKSEHGRSSNRPFRHCIWRINPEGEIDVFFKGLGLPQGLAFDSEGNLYVAASLRGRRGIVRISPDGRDAKAFVAGVNLVGLA